MEGNTIFITGGARGIGLGIARAFARAGAKLALADINQASLTTAKSELSKLAPVETFLLDVRDRSAFAGVADETEARLGPVSILCNNAGVGGEPQVSRLTYEHWDWIMGINLNGVINGIQTFLPRDDRTRRRRPYSQHGFGWGTRRHGQRPTVHNLEIRGGRTFGISATRIRAVRNRGQRSVPRSSQYEDHLQRRSPPSPGLLRKAWPGKLSPRFRLPEPILMTWAKWFSLAVKANRFYIHNDRIMVEMIEARTKALLDAMPPAK